MIGFFVRLAMTILLVWLGGAFIGLDPTWFTVLPEMDVFERGLILCCSLAIFLTIGIQE